MNQFNNLNITYDLLKGIEKKEFLEMTEVQEAVIPKALENKDIIAQAPTGTGKTLAFAIPILQSIDVFDTNVQALILAPTRELAVQITEEIKVVAQFKEHIRVVAVYGGEYIERQISSLKRKPQIIVATPGRLMDHMRRHTVKLQNIKMLVLDEADEMLNMGFKEDIDTILQSIESVHQTMLFSATISKDIEALGKTYLHKPEVIRVNQNAMNVPTITQKYVEVKEQQKIEVIARLIDIYDYKIVMVFCNTKRMVDEVTSSLLGRGYLVEALHGDMKQMQRDRVMQRFRNNQIHILVASDVAARGLDIDDVDVVFNYDVPTDEEYYVHRVGRTGRAKKQGLAIMLVTAKEKYRLRSIMAYSKAPIAILEVPSMEKVMKVRIERVINEALEKRSSKYQPLIEQLLMQTTNLNINASELIGGLIMMQLNQIGNDDVVIEKTRKGDSARMFIGLGRKDKMRIKDLVDILLQKTSLTNEQINNVQMLENFSFFEIPAPFVDEVVYAFSNTHKGRKIVVEEANTKRSDDSSSKKSYKKSDDNTSKRTYKKSEDDTPKKSSKKRYSTTKKTDSKKPTTYTKRKK